MFGGKKPVTPGDIYAAARRPANPLPVTSNGQLKSASRAVLIGYLTGTPPDLSKVGTPGDGLSGGQAIADFVNAFYGIKTEEAA